MSKEKINLKDKKILLAVSGGIAAYKAADLASRLTRNNAQVKTAMTEAACKLVSPKTFEAVTGSQVFTNLWDSLLEYRISHVSLADWADAVVVAPATANIISKMANGICDDLVSTILCACWAKPILLAPAMNENMWNNPAVQRNIKTIRNMGVKLVGPATGRLACNKEGIGRMSEPEDIIEALIDMLSAAKRKNK